MKRTINSFVNSIFTIKDFKAVAGAESLQKFDEAVNALKVMESLDNDLIRSGRVNHMWFQGLLSVLTDSAFVAGGQGDAAPDLAWGDKRIEVKGFTDKQIGNRSPMHVNSSRWFGANGGMRVDKATLTTEEINQKILDDPKSFNDDYYLLTETCGLTSIDKLEDVRIIFIDKDILKKHLISKSHPKEDRFTWTKPNGKIGRKTVAHANTDLNLAGLLEELEEKS